VTGTRVRWLSDNGPPYTAIETRDFGEKLGLLVCTTPAHSPESNGMAESFGIRSVARVADRPCGSV
jgi:putative transposase